MNPPRRLYDFLPSGNGYRVRLALVQLGVPFEHVEVDILSGGAREPWFLAKNPAGEIPVLELEDGTLLRESNAILFNITEGTPLLPASSLARTEVLRWMFFEQSNVARVMGRARFRKRWPAIVPTEPKEFEQWYAHGYRALSVMEQHLGDRDFFVENRYTAADLSLYAYTHCAEEGGFSFTDYPRVRAWFERVRNQPKYLPIDRRPSDRRTTP